MHGVKPITAEHSQDAKTCWTAQSETCGILKDLWVSAKRQWAPNELLYRKVEQLIPDTNCYLNDSKKQLHLTELW